MTDTMAVRTENKTLFDFGHHRLCRAPVLNGFVHIETFVLPLVVKVEDSPIFHATTKAMGSLL
jgi:hypothetical protein